jgi:cyclophilin family peptidyl-prolyl cis-trans isomerase
MTIAPIRALQRIGKLAAFAGTIFAASATLAADDAAPRVSFQTSLGDIVFELDREHAPITVANFVRYVIEGHFDGTVFYRVVPGFIIQAGSFDAEGKPRGVHDPIPLETATTLSNARGTMAMGHGDDPNSARAEFFINLVDNKAIDRRPDDFESKTGFATFGHVVSGMDVVDAIAALPLGGPGPFPGAAPLMPVVIQKASVLK